MADSKKAAGDSGEAEVQAKVDEANEQGFYGEAVDERDRNEYTVAGSVARQGENLDTK